MLNMTDTNDKVLELYVSQHKKLVSINLPLIISRYLFILEKENKKSRLLAAAKSEFQTKTLLRGRSETQPIEFQTKTLLRGRSETQLISIFLSCLLVKVKQSIIYILLRHNPSDNGGLYA